MASEFPTVLKTLFSHIDANKAKYIAALAETVAIKSVSAWPESRPEIFHMVNWVADRLRTLGATIELADVGKQTLPDGRVIDLPNVILGTLGNDPAKKTVVLYGHLDVQPALLEDGWDSEPFVLTERDGKLYGRGASDDKGPVLGWIHAIEAFQAIGEPVPVNLKFVFEGMEESGSEGLDELLFKRKDDFLSGVDYVCISDNYWLGTDKPCITYGLRGICYFDVQVGCAGKCLLGLVRSRSLLGKGESPDRKDRLKAATPKMLMNCHNCFNSSHLYSKPRQAYPEELEKTAGENLDQK